MSAFDQNGSSPSTTACDTIRSAHVQNSASWTRRAANDSVLEVGSSSAPSLASLASSAISSMYVTRADVNGDPLSATDWTYESNRLKSHADTDLEPVPFGDADESIRGC
jgi:hypothetical protein